VIEVADNEDLSTWTKAELVAEVERLRAELATAASTAAAVPETGSGGPD